MTNTEALQRSIETAGVSIAFLARQMGISREAFYKKLKNETEFKASEIVTVAAVLHLTNEERDHIFFAN